MRLFAKRQLPIILVAAVLLVMVGILFVSPPPAPVNPLLKTEPPQPQPPPLSLSLLAAPPDWSSLRIFENTITRDEFEHLLTTVFTTGDAWRNVIEIDETEARIATGIFPDNEMFHLRFAPALDSAARAPRNWRAATELPAIRKDLPLADLHIAVDPGHIGGDWAKMEERWFVVDDGIPVREGDMTLYVANLLKPRLETLGATVSLVRDRLEPVTQIRPETLRSLAGESIAPEDSPAALQRLAERLFYRTSEIRARADLVNKVLRPDLVLCLHFNAEAWGDPDQPTLTDRTHLHLLLNGGYNDEEVMLADQRFALLAKLLQRTHQEEALIGTHIADAFAEISGLPPYSYPPDSPIARPVAGHPYLWARNLLANRLYECPVIFMEPYVMNSTLDHARIQAGDYEGLREIEGRMRPSIFSEYASAVTEGLVRYYLLARKPTELDPAEASE